MFRFDDREEEMLLRDREAIRQIERMEKPKFKDLFAIMLAQYSIILPMVFIGIAIFGFVIWLMVNFWLG